MSTKKQRKEIADANKAVRDSLSPEQQIARLDAKLGKGLGAKKERARLKGQCNE
jgi:hypothetical protein